MNQHKLTTKSGKVLRSNSTESINNHSKDSNLEWVYNSEVGAINGYQIP